MADDYVVWATQLAFPWGFELRQFRRGVPWDIWPNKDALQRRYA